MRDRRRPWLPIDWSRPQVIRVETMVGEACVIVAHGIVEHASPSMVWSLGLSLATLQQRLTDKELVYSLVEPDGILFPVRRI